jgi:putative transposase
LSQITIQKRKSYIEIGRLYFWTATINSWYKLLDKDVVKDIIIASLQYLTDKGRITVYGFVIMPNHIHLVWQIHALNGKENAQASFLKYTAHAFKKWLQANDAEFLKLFAVEAANKSYEFWQRDSLAFELTQRATTIQKIEYMHNNPVAKHWNLAATREQYQYSSAQFYYTGENDFGFLQHIMTVV